MRKLFSLFLALVATTSLWAHDFQVGDLYYNITSGTTVEVTSQTSSYPYNEGVAFRVATIPSTVTYYGTTYNVTRIGSCAFRNCSSLTSVTIPNSVTSIGGQTFEGCSSLTSITIPNSVTSIGIYAFDGCSSLTSVTIPNSITSIGDWAFAGCSSLTSVTIPNSVTSIGNFAFRGCSSLTTPVYNAHCFAYMPTSFKGAYVIPEGIKQIAGGAFADCSSPTSVTIPNSVTSIGIYAFEGCSSLTSITIPNSVTSIGDYAFDGCSSLVSMVVESGNTKYDSRDNCNAIIETATNILIAGCQNTIIPNSVTSIGGHAFSGCSSLTSITIPNSVTSIGWWAFSHCSSLTSVTIGNSVTSIRFSAFGYCSSLDTITCLAMTPPALGENVFDRYDNTTLFVPCAALSDYQLHEQWGQFTTIECISSEEAETEEVVIESGTTTVIITWPTEEGADTYTIVIKKDGEVVCTLTFNSEGQLISIAFAPGRDGNHPAQYAEAVANGKGFRFTVTGLEDGTDYTYDITVKNEANQVIKTHSGKFTTEPYSAVDNTHSSSSATNTQKLLRNGQLIILRDGVEYNAMGQEL